MSHFLATTPYKHAAIRRKVRLSLTKVMRAFLMSCHFVDYLLQHMFVNPINYPHTFALPPLKKEKLHISTENKI